MDEFTVQYYILNFRHYTVDSKSKLDVSLLHFHTFTIMPLASRASQVCDKMLFVNKHKQKVIYWFLLDAVTQLKHEDFFIQIFYDDDSSDFEVESINLFTAFIMKLPRQRKGNFGCL